MWLNIGLSWKITKIRTTPLIFKIDLCSATLFKSSRRELSIDVAEHRSILKINQNTHYSLNFQDSVQPHHSKVRRESFPLMWLNIGLSWKITKIRATPVLVLHPKQVQNSLKQVFRFYRDFIWSEMNNIFFDKSIVWKATWVSEPTRTGSVNDQCHLPFMVCSWPNYP